MNSFLIKLRKKNLNDSKINHEIFNNSEECFNYLKDNHKTKYFFILCHESIFKYF